MKQVLCLVILLFVVFFARAQHTFRGTSLSEALIALDNSDQRYDITFVYDELEDFTVSKTIQRGRSLPDAVREVCGFYPVRVTVMGREIFVECIQKERTKLSGRLVDSEQQPVVYANILLLSPLDSTVVGGGVSNEAGDFVIPCQLEEVCVRISCVGFRTLERTLPTGRVGTIRLQTAEHRLSGVSVSGQKPVLRTEPDRLLYLVANDPFAKGHTALELLRRVPTVTMADGQVSILGRGRAGILFNGRTTAVDEETMRQRLWALRAEDIERIEVITHPSGRYQAAGGYINIVTRQGQALGWRGDLTGQLASRDDWSGRLSGQVNYAAERFDASLEGFVSRMTEQTDSRTAYERPRAFLKQDNSRDKQKDKDYGVNMLVHYQPSKCWDVGAMLSYKENRNHRDVTDEGGLRSEVDYAPYGGIGPDIREYTMASVSNFSPNGPTRTLGLTAYSDWKLDGHDKLMNLTYNYYRQHGLRESLMQGEARIPNYYTTGNYQARYSFSLDADYRIHSAKLDLTLPLPFVKINAGLDYTDINNMVVSQQQRFSSVEPENTYIHNRYHYRERNVAGYLNVHKQLHQDLTVSIGLRWDYSRLLGEERNDIRLLKTKQHFSRLLPNVALDWQLDDRQHLALHGERMIDRPNFNDLNLAPIYITMTNLTAGTPALKPGTVDFAGLDYRHSNGLYATLYYRHGSNLTQWVTRFSMERSQRYNLEYQTTRPENRLDESQGGAIVRYQRRVGSLLNAAIEGHLYYYHGKSEASHQDWSEDDVFNAGMTPLEGWGKSLALSADLFLNRQHTLLLNARYDHWFRQLGQMTDISGYGYAYLALRYTLLEERLKLSLVANDPFHQYVTDISHSYNWFMERIHTNHHAHLVSLTVTYSLGAKKVRQTFRDKKNAETQRAEKKQH